PKQNTARFSSFSVCANFRIFSIIRGIVGDRPEAGGGNLTEHWNIFDCSCSISLDKSLRLF
ncbi:MAG TPA: hypothetical protein VIL63_12455, partial [Terriglobales bacterium]